MINFKQMIESLIIALSEGASLLLCGYICRKGDFFMTCAPIFIIRDYPGPFHFHFFISLTTQNIKSK